MKNAKLTNVKNETTNLVINAKNAKTMKNAKVNSTEVKKANKQVNNTVKNNSTKKAAVTPKSTNKTAATPKVRMTGPKVATKLLQEKASEKNIIKAFTEFYNAKGIKDAKFIEVRAKIYMKIAAKELAAATPKTTAKKSTPKTTAKK